MGITLPLDTRFRLVHEPLRGKDHAWLAVGERNVAVELAQRLQHSDGGSFLVTGFRGVGKTTAAREAIRLYETPIEQQVVAIELSLAQAPSREKLLFEIVRRLYEALDQAQVLARLTPEIGELVSLAYARTSLSMKETRSLAEERQRDLGISGPLGFGPLRLPGPRFGGSRKRSSSFATELNFLAYSDSDAEYDLRRILTALHNPHAARRKPLLRALGKVGLAEPAESLGVEIVIVLDEIDKLTEPDDGMAAFEKIIGSLKSLLASSGVHFIVVGGVDLHDAWVRDTAGANSLYRSVFSWHAYTPCIWGQASELLQRIRRKDATSPPTRLVEDEESIARYLEYTARGVLRALLFEVNGLVTWSDGQPQLTISDTDLERVELLAQLQQWLEDFLDETAQSDLLANPIDEDRVRLAVHFACDWILRSGGASFSAAELVGPDAPAPIDPVLRPSKEVIETFLERLEEHGFLVGRDPRSASVTMIGEPAGTPDDKLYWLSSDAHAQLQTVARSGGRGRAQIHDTVAPGVPADLPPSVRRKLSASVSHLLQRYQLDRLLGAGGLGEVWEGRDENNTPVAIKLFHRRGRSDLTNLRRVLQAIEHPNVVRTREIFSSDETTVHVMDLVPGRSLREVPKPLPPSVAVRLFDTLLDAMEYLNERGLVRLDIKPGNIVVREDFSPVIVDLDTVLISGSATASEATFIGTLAFTAPEAYRGPADASSDVYSLAVTMIDTLGGDIRHLSSVPPTLDIPRDISHIARMTISSELKNVLVKGSHPDPDERFAVPGQMRDAIRRTPEWASSLPDGPLGDT
jgi:serine/threonine-protein kinase